EGGVERLAALHDRHELAIEWARLVPFDGERGDERPAIRQGVPEEPEGPVRVEQVLEGRVRVDEVVLSRVVDQEIVEGPAAQGPESEEAPPMVGDLNVVVDPRDL